MAILGCLGAPVTVASAQDDPDGPQIIVYGHSDTADVLAEMAAEAELDENGIAAYGQNTVGDLLNRILPQVDDGFGDPVVLINGEPASGLDEIADLPAEAVSRIQVLPREAAAVLGQNSNRRVVNVVIKPDLRQVTLNGGAELATKGEGFSADGEVNLLALANSNRRSLVLQAHHADPLFEADRGILSGTDGLPYDFFGNVLPFPLTNLEIDPALSALAGKAVFVAAVPANRPNPALTDFVPGANLANVSDLGLYRTLLATNDVYSANATFMQRLTPVSTVSLNLKVEQGESTGFSGVTAALFQLPTTSPFSPFGPDVNLARYLGPALRQDIDTSSVQFAGVFNTALGAWRLSVNANASRRIVETDSERGVDITALRAGILDGTVNPFAPLSTGQLATILADAARARADLGNLFATLTGSPFSLPTGPVHAALRAEWRGNRTRATSTVAGVPNLREYDRDEEIAQLSLRVPLLGMANRSPLGDVRLELTGALRDVSAVGGLEDYGAALNWVRGPVNLRGSFNHDEIAPPPSALVDPTVTLDGVRVYDFIRQETVLVRQVTGGNPAIPVERRRTFRLGAIVTASDDVTVSTEYANVLSRNAFSALPPLNAEVQAAFPDRFVRDVTGQLVLVDARPVPFARVKREVISTGVTFEHSSRPRGPGLEAGWLLSGALNHVWTLSSTRQARVGLPVIDLMAGGALGYGGGQPAHRVNLTGAVLHRGLGLEVNADWQSRTRIAAGTLVAPDLIVFEPRATFDLRVFANLGPLLENQRWAKGTRISLSVGNLFDSKQRVTDGTGAAPLRFQPYLLDPLGRTVRIELRKVF